MYHHFASKTEMLAALYAVESQWAAEAAFSNPGDGETPLERLSSGCLQWLETASVPEISKILFEIGPAALGTSRVSVFGDRIAIPSFEALLKQAAPQRLLDVGNVGLLARLLNTVIAEAALYRIKAGGRVPRPIVPHPDPSLNLHFLDRHRPRETPSSAIGTSRIAN